MDVVALKKSDSVLEKNGSNDVAIPLVSLSEVVIASMEDYTFLKSIAAVKIKDRLLCFLKIFMQIWI